MSSAVPSALDKRLTRILLLIPYLLKNPGTTTGELAERFGVAEEVVSEDLQLVYVCGLPGYGPGDLIDVSFTGDQVFVDTADYFGAPLRLTPAEALALYAGGQAVLELPGMEEAGALRRALRKLGSALGAGRPESSVEVHLAGGPARHMEVLGRALTDSRRVRMEYFSASRGVLTERTIDPWGLVATLGRWYLVAFDHSPRRSGCSGSTASRGPSCSTRRQRSPQTSTLPPIGRFFGRGPSRRCWASRSLQRRAAGSSTLIRAGA